MREPRPSTLSTGAPATAAPKDDMPPSPTRSPITTAATLPEFPPGDVTAGLDWATADHAVAIVNNRGTITEQFLVDATGAGLRELVRRLRRAAVGEVAIERGDGQVVDTLLDAGLTVVVISPNQVQPARTLRLRREQGRQIRRVRPGRHPAHRPRPAPLIPDTAATVQLRSAVRARKDLLTHRVGLANQLRAHLRFFHPGPVGLFADLDAVTSLRFLSRFTSQDDSDWLTPSRLATWLRSVAYTRPQGPRRAARPPHRGHARRDRPGCGRSPDSPRICPDDQVIPQGDDDCLRRGHPEDDGWPPHRCRRSRVSSFARSPPWSA
jgi:transposase